MPCPGFGLDGNARRGLRQTLRRRSEEGSDFESSRPSACPPLLPQLQAISDDWLASKTRQGEGLLARPLRCRLPAPLPVAVVRRGGRIVAFANSGGRPTARSCRSTSCATGADAPRDVMDYLFVELMLWGKEQGYRRFDLGMAPLSGLEGRKLAPLWTRAGALLFRLGEHSTISRACAATRRSSARSGSRATSRPRAGSPCRPCWPT